MENVAGCRSQAGPGAPVFREGRRNFLVPVAIRSARSWLHMRSTSIEQCSRFLMPFQWNKWLSCAGFMSVLLSSLRVFLTKISKVPCGANGLTPLLKNGWPGCSPDLLFDPQRRVIHQASPVCRKTYPESPAIPSECSLFFPFRGPNVGAHHIARLTGDG